MSCSSACPDASALAQHLVAPDIDIGIVLTAVDPTAQPPGTNVAGCKSAIDPFPVILVNATFSVAEDDFGGLAPSLANAGYCVHTFNYGGKTPNDRIQAIGPVENSARTLAAFVGQVKAVTGAAKVDLVGHSQGGNAHRVLR